MNVLTEHERCCHPPLPAPAYEESKCDVCLSCAPKDECVRHVLVCGAEHIACRACRECTKDEIQRSVREPIGDNDIRKLKSRALKPAVILCHEKEQVPFKFIDRHPIRSGTVAYELKCIREATLHDFNQEWSKAARLAYRARAEAKLVSTFVAAPYNNRYVN